ncbi:ribonuclease HII, partial [Anaerococcus hydrogenalis]
PVAGPVTVAAVILPPHAMLDGLNDSKKLSAVTREKLFKEIIETAIAYKILHIPVEVIDSVNIYQAVLDGMQAVTMSLQPAAQVLLADAMPVALPIPVQAIIRGDSQSASIAAASILAKVSRDHVMEELDIQYPQYGFAAHKGYLTEHHLSMLKKYGPSPVHRKSFEPIKSMINAF